MLPPLSYLFLLFVTLLLGPVILVRAPDRWTRRFVGRFLVGIVLFELGLVLLFYSKLLCWPLVAAGVATIGSLGSPRPWVSAVVPFLFVSVVAGVGFQALEGSQAYYFYFGFCVPLLLLSSLAVALSRWVRSWSLGSTIAAAGILAFGAFTPASAFGYSFLVDYEIYQAPFLLAMLGGLFILSRGRRMGRAIDLGSTLGDRLAAPWATGITWGGPFVLVGLAVGVLALRHAPLPGVFPVIAWAFVAFAVLCGSLLLFRLDGRIRAVLLVAGAVAGALAGLIGVRFGAEAFHVFVGGGPAPETLLFYYAGAGLLLYFLAVVLGLGRVREWWERRRMAEDPSLFFQREPIDPSHLPAGFVVSETDGFPDVEVLERERGRLITAGHPGGVLVVREPLLDPTGGLPAAVEKWLSSQGDRPVLHLAVREGLEVFLIPMVDPGEVDA